MKRLAVPALLLGLLIPASALAHQKSVSYSKWTLVDDGAIAEVRVRWLELTSLPAVRDATAEVYERSGVLPVSSNQALPRIRRRPLRSDSVEHDLAPG